MRVHVIAESAGAEGRAAQLAAELGAVPGEPGAEPALVVAVGVDSLELREHRPGKGDSLSVDLDPRFDAPLLRRAALVGTEGTRTIVDATAGLGRDALVLARGGARVTMIERSRVVAALLEDGLARARRLHPDARLERLDLVTGDAIDLLPALAPVEVVYLDPMYPLSGREGRKTKGMRLLRLLLGDPADDPELLAAARRAATRRVVVKRPLRAPPYAMVAPSGSLRGKTVRYDLYAALAQSG